MARLSEQLKYFIAKKVSEDADWRGVEIILSGHEVRLASCHSLSSTSGFWPSKSAFSEPRAN